MLDEEKEKELIDNESTPIDSVISRVESYIKKPDLVTSDTLKELLVQLESIRSDIEGESGQANMEEESNSSHFKNKNSGGITIAIGLRKKENV